MISHHRCRHACIHAVQRLQLSEKCSRGSQPAKGVVQSTKNDHCSWLRLGIYTACIAKYSFMGRLGASSPSVIGGPPGHQEVDIDGHALAVAMGSVLRLPHKGYLLWQFSKDHGRC